MDLMDSFACLNLRAESSQNQQLNFEGVFLETFIFKFKEALKYITCICRKRYPAQQQLR
jgi:hypothetical protein